MELLADLLTCYYENRGRHTFLHDPMAVFAVYDKDIITYQGKTSMWSFTDSIPEAPPLIHMKIGVETADECAVQRI